MEQAAALVFPRIWIDYSRIAGYVLQQSDIEYKPQGWSGTLGPYVDAASTNGFEFIYGGICPFYRVLVVTFRIISDCIFRLRAADRIGVLTMLVVLFFLGTIAILLFRRGLKHYEQKGSQRYSKLGHRS